MEVFRPTVGKILLAVFLSLILVPFISTTTVSCGQSGCGPGVTLLLTPFQTLYLYYAKSGFGVLYTPARQIDYFLFGVGYVFYYLVACAVLYTRTHHRLHRAKKV
jgi:hypothetical protein